MNSAKKKMSPQTFLVALRQIKLDIQSTDLTADDRNELLQEVEKMKEMVLELKAALLQKEKSPVPTA
jgi:hypothetical protein